jgi:hypothetical protein
VVECTDDILMGSPIVTSSCGLESESSTVGPTLVSGQADCDGAIYEIVYTVEDACGRTASCTQTFTLQNSAPVITCMADAVVECESDILVGTPDVTSSCGSNPSVTNVGPTLVSGAAGCDGAVYEIVYTATDDCGRSASCTQTFTISNEGPRVTCEADVIVECASDIEIVDINVVAFCGTDATVTTSGPTLVSGTADCDGAQYEVVYTATDDCGRSASCTQTFTLSNAGPSITCPADYTVECAGEILVGDATATSSCGVGVDITTSFTDLDLNDACDGAAYQIVYTATDDCNRSAACIQTVTISNDGPTIVCPTDATVECTDAIAEGTPIVTTSCDLGSTVTTTGPNLVSGTADCDGAVYELTYTVEDDCGRSTSCSQMFTV